MSNLVPDSEVLSGAMESGSVVSAVTSISSRVENFSTHGPPGSLLNTSAAQASSSLSRHASPVKQFHDRENRFVYDYRRVRRMSAEEKATVERATRLRGLLPAQEPEAHWEMRFSRRPPGYDDAVRQCGGYDNLHYMVRVLAIAKYGAVPPELLLSPASRKQQLMAEFQPLFNALKEQVRRQNNCQTTELAQQVAVLYQSDTTEDNLSRSSHSSSIQQHPNMSSTPDMMLSSTPCRPFSNVPHATTTSNTSTNNSSTSMPCTTSTTSLVAELMNSCNLNQLFGGAAAAQQCQLGTNNYHQFVVGVDSSSNTDINLEPTTTTSMCNNNYTNSNTNNTSAVQLSSKNSTSSYASNCNNYIVPSSVISSSANNITGTITSIRLGDTSTQEAEVLVPQEINGNMVFDHTSGNNIKIGGGTQERNINHALDQGLLDSGLLESGGGQERLDSNNINSSGPTSRQRVHFLKNNINSREKNTHASSRTVGERENNIFMLPENNQEVHLSSQRPTPPEVNNMQQVVGFAARFRTPSDIAEFVPSNTSTCTAEMRRKILTSAVGNNSQKMTAGVLGSSSSSTAGVGSSNSGSSRTSSSVLLDNDTISAWINNSTSAAAAHECNMKLNAAAYQTRPKRTSGGTRNPLQEMSQRGNMASDYYYNKATTQVLSNTASSGSQAMDTSTWGPERGSKTRQLLGNNTAGAWDSTNRVVSSLRCNNASERKINHDSIHSCSSFFPSSSSTNASQHDQHHNFSSQQDNINLPSSGTASSSAGSSRPGADHKNHNDMISGLLKTSQNNSAFERRFCGADVEAVSEKSSARALQTDELFVRQIKNLETNKQNILQNKNIVETTWHNNEGGVPTATAAFSSTLKIASGGQNNDRDQNDLLQGHTAPGKKGSGKKGGSRSYNIINSSSGKHQSANGGNQSWNRNYTGTIRPPVALCREFMEAGTCGKGNTCTFAHGTDQILYYRSKMCKHYNKEMGGAKGGGKCSQGKYCGFAHTRGELICYEGTEVDVHPRRISSATKNSVAQSEQPSYKVDSEQALVPGRESSSGEIMNVDGISTTTNNQKQLLNSSKIKGTSSENVEQLTSQFLTEEKPQDRTATSLEEQVVNLKSKLSTATTTTSTTVASSANSSKHSSKVNDIEQLPRWPTEQSDTVEIVVTDQHVEKIANTSCTNVASTVSQINSNGACCSAVAEMKSSPSSPGVSLESNINKPTTTSSSVLEASKMTSSATDTTLKETTTQTKQKWWWEYEEDFDCEEFPSSTATGGCATGKSGDQPPNPDPKKSVGGLEIGAHKNPSRQQETKKTEGNEEELGNSNSIKPKKNKAKNKRRNWDLEFSGINNKGPITSKADIKNNSRNNHVDRRSEGPGRWWRSEEAASSTNTVGNGGPVARAGPAASRNSQSKKDAGRYI